MRKKPVLGSNLYLVLGFAFLAGAGAAQASESDETSPWSIEASAGIEYDDNLTVEELDVTSGKEDVAAVLDLSVAYSFPGMSDYDLEAGYDFYQSLYQDFSEFNLQTHGLYLSGSREFGEIDAGLSYRFTHSRLDNDNFLQIHNLTPSLGYSLKSNWYLSVAYSYQYKDFYDQQERDGHQNALTLDNYIVFNENRSYVRLGYRFEDEDTDGPQYDYLGHYFNGGLSTPMPLFSQQAKLDLSYEYYTRDYSNITPSIGKERGDHRHRFGLGAQVDLSDAFFARLKYEYIDATSNLPSADFNENIVTVSVGRRW